MSVATLDIDGRVVDHAHDDHGEGRALVKHDDQPREYHVGQAEPSGPPSWRTFCWGREGRNGDVR